MFESVQVSKMVSVKQNKDKTKEALMGEKARQSIFGGVHNHLRSTIFDSLLASAAARLLYNFQNRNNLYKLQLGSKCPPHLAHYLIKTWPFANVAQFNTH